MLTHVFCFVLMNVDVNIASYKFNYVYQMNKVWYFFYGLTVVCGMTAADAGLV